MTNQTSNHAQPRSGFIDQVWSLLGIVFMVCVAGLLVSWTAEGAAMVRPWVWTALAALSVAVITIAVYLKMPMALAIVPLVAAPLFLSGGLRSSPLSPLSSAYAPEPAASSASNPFAAAQQKLDGFLFKF